jgi:protein-disulfide isomerase
MAGSRESLNRFYVLIGAVLVVGVGALVWMSSRPGGPTSVPVATAIQPADTAGFAGYALGPDSAPVTIVEFADYQCPACQSFEMVEFPYVRERLVQSGRVRFVYKDFPLDQHQWSRLASHAAACANDQGKFWELHEAIYRTQPEWSVARNAGARFRELAQQEGLDLAAYDACMSSLRYAGRISAMAAEGRRLDVRSTPTFLIGDRLYTGVQSYDRLRALVDSLSPAPPAP